jgi:nitrile hydratase accessory protein
MKGCPGPPAMPPFAEPWHAQLFALTVYLNETGLFAWPDWAQRFGATLKQHGLTKTLDGGDDYFTAWLETLEALVQEQGHARMSDLSALKQAWEDAYLRTPHGQPVRL